MRLRLSDDRILHNTVGKTPVMVLQEHCHKHEGQTPTYPNPNPNPDPNPNPNPNQVRRPPTLP